MPLLTQVAFALALLGAVAGFAALAFAPGVVGLLSYLFCSLWILWTVCVFVTPPAKAVQLVGLWMLIDLGLLATLLALAPALAAWRTHGGNGGHDLIVFVAYLPVIMPSALALPSFETLGVEVTLQRVLGRDYGELTATWLIMSLVAILQSVAVAATIWLLQSFWRRKSANGI